MYRWLGLDSHEYVNTYGTDIRNHLISFFHCTLRLYTKGKQCPWATQQGSDRSHTRTDMFWIMVGCSSSPQYECHSYTYLCMTRQHICIKDVARTIFLSISPSTLRRTHHVLQLHPENWSHGVEVQSMSYKAVLKDLTSCVTLGESLKSSLPWFPHLLNKSKKTAFTGLI